MSKVVQAVNTMISHPELMTKVIQGESEIFFLYKTYKWSMRRNSDGVYYLYYYPGTEQLEDLAAFDQHDWQDYDPMVVYNTKDIATREAISSFAELYRVLKENLHGINKVFEDILSDDPF
jgi:hypothetical protein